MIYKSIWSRGLAVLMCLSVFMTGCGKKNIDSKDTDETEIVTEEQVQTEIVTEIVGTRRAEFSEIYCEWATPLVRTEDTELMNVVTFDGVNISPDDLEGYLLEGNIEDADIDYDVVENEENIIDEEIDFEFEEEIEQESQWYDDYITYVGLLHLTLNNALVEPFSDEFFQVVDNDYTMYIDWSPLYTDYINNEMYLEIKLLLPKSIGLPNDLQFKIQDSEGRCEPVIINAKDSENVKILSGDVYFNQPFRVNLGGTTYTVICVLPVLAEFDDNGRNLTCFEWTTICMSEKVSNDFSNINKYTTFLCNDKVVDEMRDVETGTYLYEGAVLLGKGYNYGKQHIISGDTYFTDNMRLQIGDRVLRIGDYFARG